MLFSSGSSASFANATTASTETKTAAALLVQLLTKSSSTAGEEVQYGRTKIFIRKPETFAALEKLREHRMGDFVCCIQRAWRQYHMRRELLTMQIDMAGIYAKARKARRRDSIFRPYQVGSMTHSTLPHPLHPTLSHPTLSHPTR